MMTLTLTATTASTRSTSTIVGGGGGFGPCRHIHDTDTRIDCVIYRETVYIIYIS